MEEEIKNEELERIVNDINKNFDKPWRRAAAEIIQRGGGTLINSGKIENLCEYYTENGVNYVKFYGEYKEKARLMNELKEFIDFLDKGNYQWI